MWSIKRNVLLLIYQEMPPRRSQPQVVKTPGPNEFGLFLSKARIQAHLRYYMNDEKDSARIRAIGQLLKEKKKLAESDEVKVEIKALSDEKKTINEGTVRIGNGTAEAVTAWCDHIVEDIITHSVQDCPPNVKTINVEHCFTAGSERYPFISFVRSLTEYTNNLTRETQLEALKKAENSKKKDLTSKLATFEADFRTKLAAGLSEADTDLAVKKARDIERKRLTAEEEAAVDEDDGELRSFDSYIHNICDYITEVKLKNVDHTFSSRYREFLSEVVSAFIQRVAGTLRAMILDKNFISAHTLQPEHVMQYIHAIMVHENFSPATIAEFDASVLAVRDRKTQKDQANLAQKQSTVTEEQRVQKAVADDEKQKKKAASLLARLEKKKVLTDAKVEELRKVVPTPVKA